MKNKILKKSNAIILTLIIAFYQAPVSFAAEFTATNDSLKPTVSALNGSDFPDNAIIEPGTRFNFVDLNQDDSIDQADMNMLALFKSAVNAGESVHMSLEKKTFYAKALDRLVEYVGELSGAGVTREDLNYSVFADLNASGNMNISDMNLARSLQSRFLELAVADSGLSPGGNEDGKILQSVSAPASNMALISGAETTSLTATARTEEAVKPIVLTATAVTEKIVSFPESNIAAAPYSPPVDATTNAMLTLTRGEYYFFKIDGSKTLDEFKAAANLQGGSTSTADQILVLKEANGVLSYDVYFFNTIGLLGAGWRGTPGTNIADVRLTGYVAIKKCSATPSTFTTQDWMHYYDPAVLPNYREKWVSDFRNPPVTGVTNLTEGGENGLAGVTLQAPAGYDILNSRVFADPPPHSFHLTHTGFQEESFTLNTAITPQANTVLKFKSMLRWATDTQIARVQISANNGAWTDLTGTAMPQAGSNGPGESSFSAKELSLGAYAGQSIRIRFYYSIAPNGSAMMQTNDTTGWFVDQILVITNGQTVLSEGAENGLSNVTMNGVPSYYNPISSTIAADTAFHSFHLTSYAFQEESVTLNTPITPQVNTVLKFKSLLKWATSDQVARVQVFSNGVWTDLTGTGMPQAGSNGPGETAWSDKTLSLGAYAGQTIQIRFLYSITPLGSAMMQTNDSTGWFIDNISVTTI